MPKLIVWYVTGRLFGCVTVQGTRRGPNVQRNPVPPDGVAIYRTADEVTERYEEVALLSAEGDVNLLKDDLWVKILQEKAGVMGANAIILRPGRLSGTATRIEQALAICVKDPSAVPRSNPQ